MIDKDGKIKDENLNNPVGTKNHRLNMQKIKNKLNEKKEESVKEKTVTKYIKPKTNISGFKQWSVNLPNPGTIAFPLLILLMFYLILQKINNQSRLQWLYNVTIGNASLTGENKSV